MLLQMFQTNIFKVIYFSFIKQRKPKDSTVIITLPLMPDVPPPAGVVGVPPAGVPVVPDAYIPVMLEIFL